MKVKGYESSLSSFILLVEFYMPGRTVGDGEAETRERVKWRGLQKAVLGEIGNRGDS
jgi:hypothetical protein